MFVDPSLYKIKFCQLQSPTMLKTLALQRDFYGLAGFYTLTITKSAKILRLHENSIQ